jgi:hypothetical protein
VYFSDSKGGESYRGTMLAPEAIKLAEANKEHFGPAYGELMKNLREKESKGQAVDVSMTSADEKTGSLTFGSEATGKWTAHNANLSGFKNTREALNITDWGSRETGGNKRDVTNTNLTGNIKRDYDINTKEIDHGTNVGGTALQMAQTGNRSLYSGVVKAYQSNDLAKTSAEISETSSKIMKGLSNFVTQDGKNAHKAVGRAYAELGLGTPSISPYSAKVGARGEVSVSTDKDTTVNLITKALDDIQTKALKEGERLGYSGKALESHVAAKTAQFVNTWKSFATSDQEFGATKPGDMLKKAGKGVVDSGAPLPMASASEQDRRRENLEKIKP